MTRTPARLGRSALVVAAIGLAFGGTPSTASASGLLGKSTAKTARSSIVNERQAAAISVQVQQSIDEQRYVDAGTYLDQAALNGVKSAELTTLTGELYLARNRFADSLVMFHQADVDGGQNPRTLQGEGIALSMLGRSDDALAALKASTRLDPSLWRAWNGLGREYDLRRDWANARVAYDTALAAPHA